MNIYKDWKAKLERAYSFMLKYSKITVCSSQYCQTVLSLVEIFEKKQNLCCAVIRGFPRILEKNQMALTLVALFQDCFMSLL